MKVLIEFGTVAILLHAMFELRKRRGEAQEPPNDVFVKGSTCLSLLGSIKVLSVAEQAAALENLSSGRGDSENGAIDHLHSCLEELGACNGILTCNPRALFLGDDFVQIEFPSLTGEVEKSVSIAIVDVDGHVEVRRAEEKPHAGDLLEHTLAFFVRASHVLRRALNLSKQCSCCTANVRWRRGWTTAVLEGLVTIDLVLDGNSNLLGSKGCDGAILRGRELCLDVGAGPHLLLCKEIVAIEDKQAVLGETML